MAKAKVFKQKYGAKFEFPEGWGCKPKKTSGVGGYGYLLEPHNDIIPSELTFSHNPKAEVVLSNSPYKSLA